MKIDVRNLSDGSRTQSKPIERTNTGIYSVVIIKINITEEYCKLGMPDLFDPIALIS